jgi:hypothetical protein
LFRLDFHLLGRRLNVHSSFSICAIAFRLADRLK